jgi:hypothetical protein
MTPEQQEHAQLGALLARCWNFKVEYALDWSADIQLKNGRVGSGYGDTQLAAIKAAVEAAEKGVRE